MTEKVKSKETPKLLRQVEYHVFFENIFTCEFCKFSRQLLAGILAENTAGIF